MKCLNCNKELRGHHKNYCGLVCYREYYKQLGNKTFKEKVVSDEKERKLSSAHLKTIFTNDIEQGAFL